MPPGIVLTTAVYEHFLSSNGLGQCLEAWARESTDATPSRLVEISRKVETAFEAASLPPAVYREIDAWTRQSIAGAFAVRSSATNEDLVGASFAGLYTSFLHVSPENVARSVVRCFASLYSAQAELYRRRRGVAGRGLMAVIVQEMIATDIAGVIFTRAPLRRDELLIECAPGLGEAVVSGVVSPNRYFVNRSTLRVELACEPHAVDRSCLPSLARQALVIEEQLGGPQDIEYGVVNGTVYILQARPVASVTGGEGRESVP